jgi:Flp pilus assembly protein TadD
VAPTPRSPLPTACTRRDLSIGIGLFVATLVVYAQTLGFDFVHFDDNIYILNVAWVRAGLSLDGLLAAFSERMATTNWSPLVGLSLMLDAELYGVDPAGFHLTNALLHAGNAVLVYALLRSLTGDVWRSALVAALFALHPLRVESVAWVSSRKDVLGTACGLLAMLAYTRWARHRERSAQLGALACCALALMSKPIWVTLPFLLLLLDFWPLDRLRWDDVLHPRQAAAASRGPVLLRLVVEKLPFFALSLAVALVTLAYQDVNRIALGLGVRLENAIAACGWYLVKTLWPTQLSFFYPHPYIPHAGGVPWSGTALALSGALLVAISVGVLHQRRHRYLLVGWLWFLGTLAPVLGLFAQAGTQGMADRYTYLPHIGLFILLVFGAWDLLAPRLRTKAAQRAAIAAASALLVVLGAASAVQSRIWRDTGALFSHGLEITPRNALVLQGMGNHHRRNGRLEAARDYYRRALDVHPRYPTALRHLVDTQIQLGDLDGAISAYRSLILLYGDNARLHDRLAYVLYARGDVEAAARHTARVVELVPGSLRARWQLGWLLRESGDVDGALLHYGEVVSRLPDALAPRQALETLQRQRGGETP